MLPSSSMSKMTRLLAPMAIVRMTRLLALVALVAAILGTTSANNDYYGEFVGDFKSRFHDVSGEVFAVDSRTIYIKGFSYDGQGPDAYFYVGEKGEPSGNGILIADEKGTTDILGSYRNKDIVLTLPGGMTLRTIRWLSVWCDAFGVNFGELRIPRQLRYPRPQKIRAFNGIHDVESDKVVVVDAQTFLIPNFTYNGQAPDAHFFVGTGSRPGPDGHYVADENGSNEPLRKYSEKTLVIVLPGDLTVFDIDWLSVWCVAFYVDFGHVRIPRELNVPPSLRMLGIEPQSKLNCEVLDDQIGFEVRWAIAGKSIVTQLVARLNEGQYMAFGLSGEEDRSRMVGGDVTVAWMDHKSGKGYAEDYYLDAKSQCAGKRGACPDNQIRSGTNNVRLLNSAVINDFTMLTFRQPLAAKDRFDTMIYTNESQPIIWAVGPVNSKGEVSYHQKRLRGDEFYDFGRIPQWNCPIAGKPAPQTQKQKKKEPPTPAPAPVSDQPWFIPAIQCYEPEDGVFFAQIGPTGGDNGYSAITKHVGWGISWYINGLLIPEINVIRGKTYTFVVEGGNDKKFAAGYHPFYITDDPEGGYEFKNARERRKVRVFAGVEKLRNGDTQPAATGRLCEWKEDPRQPAYLFSSFGAYQRSLSLNCQEGQPGILQWTPDRHTPDTVYYQCYTHRFLGWKINVLDECNQ